MRTVRRIVELRQALSEARAGGTVVGLVPTMGGFHAGHLSLIQRARAECDLVVVSLFVNPRQFDDPRDLQSYPRDEQRDAELAAEHGVDFLFAPSPQELYPDGYSTTVRVEAITERLEGSHRGRGHFDGVATVVSKLLNIVGPEVAYFGQKDAQQALVIRRLVADLNLPVRIAVCPTIREPDGLAMSSRNVRLNPQERARAASLYRALCAVRDALEQGAADPRAARQAGLEVLVSAGVTVEYLEVVSPHTLEPVDQVTGQVLAVVAGRVGTTRLIDNLTILPAAGVRAPDHVLATGGQATTPVHPALPGAAL
ncbi:MAG TPA: pantoate--beta-alanine ligase [Solirubrobacteraceae bacterium]|nr:pantoate--beta-alanine ligase [Solirubrobacteraceae bacterium]